MTGWRHPTSVEGVTAKAVYRKPHPGRAVGDRPLHMKTGVRVLPSNVADTEKTMPTKQYTGTKSCIVTSQPAHNTEGKEEEGAHLLLGRDDIPVVEPKETVPADSSCCSKVCLWYISTCCARTETDDD